MVGIVYNKGNNLSMLTYIKDFIVHYRLEIISALAVIGMLAMCYHVLNK